VGIDVRSFPLAGWRVWLLDSVIDLASNSVLSQVRDLTTQAQQADVIVEKE